MDRIMPWPELESLIEPHYPKDGNGRPPIGRSIMLRIYFLQHWFNLSDPAAANSADYLRQLSHSSARSCGSRST
jgi:IS5 family transposase